MVCILLQATNTTLTYTAHTIRDEMTQKRFALKNWETSCQFNLPFKPKRTKRKF